MDHYIRVNEARGADQEYEGGAVDVVRTYGPSKLQTVT